MATLNTVIVYPKSCLHEATNTSEGRGTTNTGAPFMEPKEWIAATESVGIPLEGISLHPIQFTPKFQKHVGTLCRGERIEIHNRFAFQPYRFGIAL